MKVRPLLGIFTIVACLTLSISLLTLPAQTQEDRGLRLDGTTGARNNRRVALVIGNSAYEVASLKNPVNDAHDIAQTLRAMGFEVTHKQNLSQNEMKRSIKEFGIQAKDAGIRLFYFAGHGVQVNGENYLIPVGAAVDNEHEVEYESVNVGQVLAQMEDSRNSLNIVILDACRNNPFARSFRSSTRGLMQMRAPTGTLLAYATAPGQVASDGNERNGIYTQELLKYMQTPGLGVEEVFKRVRISVLARTQGRQTPWESSSLTGDFYFIANSALAVTDQKQSSTQSDSAAIELSFWDSIKNSTEPEDFALYLKRYPDGRFAELARRRAVPKALDSISDKTVGAVVDPIRSGDKVSSPITGNNSDASILFQVSVTDSYGQPINGIARDAFSILDGSTPQTITYFSKDDPVSVGIMLDMSKPLTYLYRRGSKTNPSPISMALSRFIQQSNPANDYFVAAFNRITLPLSGLTNDEQMLLSSLERLNSLNLAGPTKFYEACYESAEALLNIKHRRRILVMITDGDFQDYNSLKSLTEHLKTKEILLYIVIAGEVDNLYTHENVNVTFPELTSISGGRVFNVGNNIAAFIDSFDRIRSELRSQYLIGINPSSSPKRDWRQVKVEVAPSDGSARMFVRSRKGYLPKS